MSAPIEKSRFSRRSFLKGAASAGIFLSVSPLLAQGQVPSLANLETYTKFTSSHWGAFEAVVEGGRLTQANPFSKNPNPSPVIQGLPDLLYSPNRVKYPMIREGFYKNRHFSDTTGRGADSFVRVSWEEALDIVAEELERVKGQYGNEAIYGGSYGWNSAGRLHGRFPNRLVHRFLNLFGGYVDDRNTYSGPVEPVIMPYVVGSRGVQTTVWPNIVENTTLLVTFGYAGLTINQVGKTEDEVPTWINELKNKGVPVVSFNPVREDFDEFIGTEWKPLRPNTDTALILGFAHVLYNENLYNQDFIDKYTVGFDKFVQYLNGETDGQPKTPEWAASISEVDADTIRTLARRMAENRTLLWGGYSLQRQDHGEQPEWALVTLAAMLGQIGLPGGGVHLGYPANKGVPRGSAPFVPTITEGDNPIDKFVPVNMWVDLLLNPGKTIDYDGGKITYPDIKLTYWIGGNPFHHAHDTNRVLQAWRNPEVHIVQEHSWTATAKHADIVLPATTTMERNDIEGSDRNIIAMQKVVDPLFESRNDFDIFAGLAKRLGFEEQFTEGKAEMDWIQQFYNVARTQAQANGVNIPDFDAFWDQGFVEFDVPEEANNFVAYADFRADPGANPLGTASGKIEIYSETIASYNYNDVPPHASWVEPFEWLGSDKANVYPLHVVTSHPKYRLHSQMNNTWIRTLYEVNEREPIWVNPQDAEARGIEDGDIVRVFNDRGQVLAGVVVTDRVRAGVVQLREGGWYDPEEPGKVGTLCKHGNVNMVTSDEGSSKLAQGNPSNTLLVQIEKYDGRPHITAFEPGKGQ